MKITELAKELKMTGEEVLEKAKAMGVPVAKTSDDMSDMDTVAVRNTLTRGGAKVETKVARKTATKKSAAEKKENQAGWEQISADEKGIRDAKIAGMDNGGWESFTDDLKDGSDLKTGSRGNVAAGEKGSGTQKKVRDKINEQQSDGHQLDHLCKHLIDLCALTFDFHTEAVGRFVTIHLLRELTIQQARETSSAK